MGAWDHDQVRPVHEVAPQTRFAMRATRRSVRRPAATLLSLSTHWPTGFDNANGSLSKSE